MCLRLSSLVNSALHERKEERKEGTLRCTLMFTQTNIQEKCKTRRLVTTPEGNITFHFIEVNGVDYQQSEFSLAFVKVESTKLQD